MVRFPRNFRCKKTENFQLAIPINTARWLSWLEHSIKNAALKTRTEFEIFGLNSTYVAKIFYPREKNNEPFWSL